MQPDFIALELLDGRLMLKLDTGEGVRNVMTQARYNFGDWVSVNVTRSGRRGTLYFPVDSIFHTNLLIFDQ